MSDTVIFDSKVSQTSIDQYRSLWESGDLNDQQRTVLKALLKEAPCTRREMRDNQLQSWELSTMSGRVNELIDKDLAEKTGKRPCKRSGVKAEIVDIPPQKRQLLTRGGVNQ